MGVRGPAPAMHEVSAWSCVPARPCSPCEGGSQTAALLGLQTPAEMMCCIVESAVVILYHVARDPLKLSTCHQESPLQPWCRQKSYAPHKTPDLC